MPRRRPWRRRVLFVVPSSFSPSWRSSRSSRESKISDQSRVARNSAFSLQPSAFSQFLKLRAGFSNKSLAYSRVVRSYSEIVDRLKAANLEFLTKIGTVHDYPVFKVVLGSQSGERENILITGGVHGDETAGVEASLKFLERDNVALLKRFSFWVFPCINPHGYVHDTRENGEGADVNRSFATDDVPEASIVKRALGQTQFAFAIDFHEDCDATGVLPLRRKKGQAIHRTPNRCRGQNHRLDR